MRLVEYRSALVRGAEETEHTYILDRDVPLAATSCGMDGRERRHDAAPAWQQGWRTTDHHAAHAPKTFELLDCPCDIACPRCSAGVGQFCTTLDGGGSSGGGFRTKWHAVRVKQSPACQAVANGSVTRCDIGQHTWAATEVCGVAACTSCDATASYTPAPPKVTF